MVSVSPVSPVAAATGYAAAGSVSSPMAVVTISIEQGADGLASVKATIKPAEGEEKTVLLQMYDGEEATLALPGHTDASYHFRRSGDVVTARIDS